MPAATISAVCTARTSGLVEIAIELEADALRALRAELEHGDAHSRQLVHLARGDRGPRGAEEVVRARGERALIARHDQVECARVAAERERVRRLGQDAPAR